MYLLVFLSKKILGKKKSFSVNGKYSPVRGVLVRITGTPKYLGIQKYHEEVPIQNIQVAAKKISIKSDLIELWA